MKAINILSILSLSRPFSRSLGVIEQGVDSEIVIRGGNCGGGAGDERKSL